MAERPKEFDRRRANPTDPAFEIAASPFYWLARTTGRYVLRMDVVLKRIGMDVPRWRVLMLLTQQSPSSVSELAEHAVIRLSTMTKIVLRMKVEGFVETRVSEYDGRVTEVLLTAEGSAKVEQIRTQAGRIYEQAFRDIGDVEMHKFNQTLMHIFTNLDE